MIDLSTIRDLVAIFGVIAGFSYYVMTVRNQSKTRQAQLFMQMIDKFAENTEDFDIIVALQRTDVHSVDDFLSLWENDETFGKGVKAMVRFGEGLGVLVKEGLLDIRFVASIWAGHTRMFWDWMGPILPELAERWNYPRLWSETAYLCRELIKYMKNTQN